MTGEQADGRCEFCGGEPITVRTHQESVVVDASPREVYDLVSDVSRTGEWSPICKACWWDDGAGPTEGAWFTGRNETPDRTWETRSLVIAARPGEEFAWLVGGGLVRWGYTMAPAGGGTALTESWEFRPEGLTYFHEKYGDEAHARIAQRIQQARTGIPATLQAIKAIAERQASR